MKNPIAGVLDLFRSFVVNSRSDQDDVLQPTSLLSKAQLVNTDNCQSRVESVAAIIEHVFDQSSEEAFRFAAGAQRSMFSTIFHGASSDVLRRVEEGNRRLQGAGLHRNPSGNIKFEVVPI